MSSARIELATFPLQILHLTHYANWATDVRTGTEKKFNSFLMLVTIAIVSIGPTGTDEKNIYVNNPLGDC